MTQVEASSASNVFITGIPRSGTSYFCVALHNLKDCVAINEPEEIFDYLDDAGAPWGIKGYYAEVRARILEGRPVLNKISNGRLIEDTAIVCSDEPYTPVVSSPNFLLATKNTLGYLSRLRNLSLAMPGAVRFACVRNPFDTIASWKGTFGHLSEAAVRGFRRGYCGDQMMRDSAQRRLEGIAAEHRVEVKRALLWAHLATLILEDRHTIAHVVRYEDFAVGPEPMLQQLLQQIPGSSTFVPKRPFQPSAVRRNRLAGLTMPDIVAIRRECRETAEMFGYDVNAALTVEA